MLRLQFFLLFIFTIQNILQLALSTTFPCPFNDQCRCANGTGEWIYNSITCGPNLPEFPSFPLPERSLTVYTMTIMGNVAKLDANSLLPFRTIYILNLEHTAEGDQPILAEWDDSTFTGLQIQLRFSISNLAGVLPPPESLKVLGRNGLAQLSVTNCASDVKLEAHAFSDFTNLCVIHMEDTPIVSIDETAFAGLEDRVYWLELRSAKLIEFPRHALKNMNALEYTLDVSDNGMSQFHSDDFTAFSKLKILMLNGNDLKSAVESRALYDLPSTLKTLSMENSGLDSIPMDVLHSNQQLEFLLMADNKIENIRDGDFPEGIELGVLDLSGNPITTIGPETFHTLINLRSLKIERSQLTSIDFSIFEGLNKLTHLDFDWSTQLRWIHVTDIEKVPASIAFLEFGNTGLERIDAQLDKVVEKPFSAMWFQNNTKLMCDDEIYWMAKRAFCPAGPNEPLLGLSGSECANLGGKSLEEYLKEMVPDPCRNHFLEAIVQHDEIVTEIEGVAE